MAADFFVTKSYDGPARAVYEVRRRERDDSPIVCRCSTHDEATKVAKALDYASSRGRYDQWRDEGGAYL